MRGRHLTWWERLRRWTDAVFPMLYIYSVYATPPRLGRHERSLMDRLWDVTPYDAPFLPVHGISEDDVFKPYPYGWLEGGDRCDR